MSKRKTRAILSDKGGAGKTMLFHYTIICPKLCIGPQISEQNRSLIEHRRRRIAQYQRKTSL